MYQQPPPGWMWSPSARRTVALSCSSLSPLMWKGRRKCLENLRVGFKPLIPAGEEITSQSPGIRGSSGGKQGSSQKAGFIFEETLAIPALTFENNNKKMGIEKKNRDMSPGERRLSRSQRVGDSTPRVRDPAMRTGLRLRGGLHGDARFKGDKMGTEPPKSPILAPLVRWAPPLFLLLRSPVPAAMDVAANPSKGQRAQMPHAVPGTRCSHRRGQAAPSTAVPRRSVPLPSPVCRN